MRNCLSVESWVFPLGLEFDRQSINCRHSGYEYPLRTDNMNKENFVEDISERWCPFLRSQEEH